MPRIPDPPPIPNTLPRHLIHRFWVQLAQTGNTMAVRNVAGARLVEIYEADMAAMGLPSERGVSWDFHSQGPLAGSLVEALEMGQT